MAFWSSKCNWLTFVLHVKKTSCLVLHVYSSLKGSKQPTMVIPVHESSATSLLRNPSGSWPLSTGYLVANFFIHSNNFALFRDSSEPPSQRNRRHVLRNVKLILLLRFRLG
ncbi:hypothetical protein CDAR_283661 [Caerostris darwini]|uniref:Secreted protein n=1 Tax=Caerostris darwini TaxID=1538125 RepID=A0AAV4TVY5_9ARAC|nr:hypothetical protein CDAR_283661 [Caerostris darwini]